MKTKIQASIGREHFVSRLTLRSHSLLSDEPLTNGGADAGPTPTELIISGLAACTASTLRMYSDKKGWEVEKIEVETGIRIDRTDAGQTSHLETEIHVTGNITDEQRERLLEIARKCPIHRLLTNPINILTEMRSAT